FIARARPLRNGGGKIVKWFGVATNIDALIHTEEALVQSAEQHHELSRQLLQMQESERRLIARELHDQVGQSLSLVQLRLQALQMELGPETLQSELADCYS